MSPSLPIHRQVSNIITKGIQVGHSTNLGSSSLLRDPSRLRPQAMACGSLILEAALEYVSPQGGYPQRSTVHGTPHIYLPRNFRCGWSLSVYTFRIVPSRVARSCYRTARTAPTTTATAAALTAAQSPIFDPAASKIGMCHPQ